MKTYGQGRHLVRCLCVMAGFSGAFACIIAMPATLRAEDKTPHEAMEAQVEVLLPAEIRSEAWDWEKIWKEVSSPEIQNRLFWEFHTKRTAALRRLLDQDASEALREAVRLALKRSAAFAESAVGMLSANGMENPEERGITWPEQSREISLLQLRVIGPILNGDTERRFAAWRVGHQRVEVAADDEHVLLDRQDGVIARHRISPAVVSHDAGPPCFLADGTVMSNDAVPGTDKAANFRCVKDGRTIAECPSVPWVGWRDYFAAYTPDGMSVTFWSPGHRGAASALLEIDGRRPQVAMLQIGQILDRWPANRSDSVRLTENNEFLPLPGHPGLALVRWSTRHGEMVVYPVMSIVETTGWVKSTPSQYIEDRPEFQLALLGADGPGINVLWGRHFGLFGEGPIAWIGARVPADGPYPYAHGARHTRFPRPDSAHHGVWILRVGTERKNLDVIAWTAGNVIEAPGDPSEELWLIAPSNRIGVLGSDLRFRATLRFVSPNGGEVRPFALFPSLKCGLFGAGAEMVFAGWN